MISAAPSGGLELIYRRVGQSGLKVSAVSIGGWLTFGNSVDAETTHAILRAAAEVGVNSIDLADAYAEGEAERIVGRWLQDRRRADFVLSSKVFWPMSEVITDRGLSRKHIFESIDRSLGRLGTDYLDIYYCHREDPEVPLDETITAMNDLVRLGKVLYWGTSMWSPGSLRRAHATARHHNLAAPIVEQPQYNLLHRWIEKKVLPTAKRLGMGIMIWSPLAGGLLTGKYARSLPAESRAAKTQWLAKDLTPENIQRIEKLRGLAEAHGVPLPGLVLAWILRNPSISSVITGATIPQQVIENANGVEIKISNELDRQIQKLFPA
jgi:voltage-dependent potassium channel beta subunit